MTKGGKKNRKNKEAERSSPENTADAAEAAVESTATSAEILRFEMENEEYESDLEDYISPLEANEDTETIAAWTNTSAFFPEEDIELTCKWYDEVLTGSYFLTEKLRKMFNFSGGFPTELCDCDDLRVRLIDMCNNPDYGFTLKCITHFLGHLIPGVQTQRRHAVCYRNFLNPGLTRYERDQVLYTLCINSYWRLAQSKASPYLRELYNEWEPMRTDIAKRFQGAIDWDVSAHKNTNFHPPWPVFVALWWVAQDRRLLVSTARDTRLPPPPFLENQKSKRDDYPLEAKSYLLRLVRGEQQTYAQARWAQWRNPKSIPDPLPDKEAIRNILICYEPYRSGPWFKEFLDLVHMTKIEWEGSYMSFLFSLEEYISFMRCDAPSSEARYRRAFSRPDDMNVWAFNYLLYHPCSRYRLEQYLPDTHEYHRAAKRMRLFIDEQISYNYAHNSSFRHTIFPARKHAAIYPHEEWLIETYKPPMQADLYSYDPQLEQEARPPVTNFDNNRPFSWKRGANTETFLTSKLVKRNQTPLGKRGEIETSYTPLPTQTSASSTWGTRVGNPHILLSSTWGTSTHQGNQPLMSSYGKHVAPPSNPPRADASDAEKAKYFDTYIRNIGLPSKEAGARIFSTGIEMRLVAPESGKLWSDIDVWHLLLKFKENIATMGKTDDLTYRLSHMDSAWINYLNQSLFELHFRSPPVEWMNLNDRDFFHECDKVFGKMRLASSSIHYASNTLFTEKFNEWLATEYSEGKQLWTGNYEVDKEKCANTLSTYSLLATQYPLSASEKEPETELIRLTDMRRAIHKAACKAFNAVSGGIAKQAPLNFMLQLDRTVNPGIHVRDTNTLECRLPTSLIDSVHTHASYVTSKDPNLALPKGVTIELYLQIALVVMLQLQQKILRPALSFGLKIPKKPNQEAKPRGNGDGKGSGNRSSRDEGNPRNKGDRKNKADSNSKGGQSERNPKKDSTTRDKNPKKTKRGKEKPQITKCYGCGNYHDGDCLLKDHPDANKDSSITWAESEYGKKWKEEGEKKLPWNRSLADTSWNPTGKSKWASASDSRRDIAPGAKRRKRGDKDDTSTNRETEKSDDEKSTGSNRSKGSAKSNRSKGSAKSDKSNRTRRRSNSDEETEDECEIPYPSINTIIKKPTQQTFLITCTLYSTPSRILDRNVACLIDTGAIDRSYVSPTVGNELKKMGAKADPCDIAKICSCSSSMCFECQGIVTLYLKFFNEKENSFEKIKIKATIIESDFDIIIGRPDIGRYNLIDKLYIQIFGDILEDSDPDADVGLIAASEKSRAGRVSRLMTASLRTDAHHSEAPGRPAAVCDNLMQPGRVSTIIPVQGRQANKDIPETSGSPRSCNDEGKRNTSRSISRQISERNLAENQISEIEHVKNTTQHRSKLLSGTHDPFEECDLDDEEDTWDPIKGNDSSEKTFVICGPEELQTKIKILLEEFKDIFSDKLNKEPAKVLPMTLSIDKTKWDAKRNRLPPRLMSTAKQKELKNQVETMLDQQLIRPSRALSWSQVLLTPKPNGQWRFCVDYRALNDASKAEGWPLPNISQMLRRIGETKPQYFAIMDLTKGFYQAPLSEESKQFTAFTCFCGLYEWNRIPMGLKGAPSFFQMVLATIVFVGLINYIMELYIDDLIIHGKNIPEFISRLRTVFETLRKFKMTVNPAKCRFGISEIEYVGHVIDPTGLSFSKDKREKVRMFPKPTNCKHVKQFLGLVNYFRDHVAHISVLMRPMQQMILKYEKARRVEWTPEAEDSFEKIKNAIADAAKLYFVDDDIAKNPVILEVDACDYGIGAYLYQMQDGQEHPIQFISKALNTTQLKWATGEKEAYAIFYGIKKLRPLLRDIYFTLRTDHKNLTYINESASAKVNRWKLELMEYNFDCEHVAGVKNVVADSLSRLMTLRGNAKVNGYENLKISPAHGLAVLALPEGGKLSPFKTTKEVYKLLAKCHNKFQGHSGVERTYLRAVQIADSLKEKIPNLRAHVQDYIKKCPCCQKMSQLKAPILSRRFITSTYTPNERIYIDSIGPLVADDKNNIHIVTVIDGFSRWIELYAVPDVSAETAAKVALLDWVGRFGLPLQIMTDGGTQFTNDLWDELSQLIGSEKLESFPHSHEENGLIERANKEVMRHLRAIIFDDKLQYSNWSTYLPLVQRIMNGSPVGATGITPAQLLFGNAVSINERILPEQQGYVTSKPLSVITSDMLKMQHHLIGLHEKLLRKHDTKHLAIPFDTLKKIDYFPNGSYVLVDYDPSSVMGRRPTHKLMPFKRGPYRVVNSIGSRYTLLDLVQNKHEDVLIHRLHPFRYDQEFLDPKEIAMRDKEEYEVEKVLNHEGDIKLKGQMKFLVKWKGYDESHNSWEPWKNLRLVDKLHAYLRKHKMGKIIPKECLNEQTPEPSRHTKKRVRIDEQLNEYISIENNNTSRRSKRKTTN